MNYKYEQSINLGIHVFLTRKDARKYNLSLIVLPVFVKKEDLVAIGKNNENYISAVFTKVFLPTKST